jgi:replicative DNA helicase
MENNTVKKIFEVAEEFRPTGKPVMTAVQDFDRAMDGGIRGGEMITLSGQSGSGKTSYALWLTKEIVDSGVPCLWFTYEMNPWYLKEKLVALGAKEEFATYVPIKHDDNSENWLRDRIIEAKEKYACKVIFIDHLHYLIPPNQEQNSSLIIGGVARKIKQLAVETDTIIFLIAHMRRLQMGERVNVDAIRDSALIANESDYVFLIERIKAGQKKKLEVGDEEWTNYSQVSLAKNRRTGNMFNKIFRVQNHNFVLATPEEIQELKNA